MTDPAARLHRQRRFAHLVEDRTQVVFDAAHDEAVEQRYRAVRTRAGNDPPGWQKTKIGQPRCKLFGPSCLQLLAARFCCGGRPRKTRPGVVDRRVDW